MNLAQQLAERSQAVTNREKLDLIFNEFVLPRIEKSVENKGRETSFNSFSSPDKADKKVKELFPEISRLQTLIETEMRPYLEELGFKVPICTPNYYAYIRW